MRLIAHATSSAGFLVVAIFILIHGFLPMSACGSEENDPLAEPLLREAFKNIFLMRDVKITILGYIELYKEVAATQPRCEMDEYFSRFNVKSIGDYYNWVLRNGRDRFTSRFLNQPLLNCAYKSLTANGISESEIAGRMCEHFGPRSAAMDDAVNDLRQRAGFQAQSYRDSLSAAIASMQCRKE